MARRIAVEVNPSIVGGTERFLAGMLAALDRERYVPTAIFHADGPVRAVFDAAGIETRILKYAEETDASLAEAIRYFRDREMAIVQSSYFSPVLALAASRAGVPHVWRFGGHVDVVHQRGTEHQKKVVLSLATLLSRKLVCGSQFLRQQFELIAHPSVEVIYNGLDLSRVGPPVPAAVDAAPVIAMVAHLVEQKRHEDFLRAAARVAERHPQVRFQVFGAPYPYEASIEYAARMRQLAADLGLGSRIEFTEGGDDRFDRFRAVSIFVLPSVNEGASNAILEAFALGRPVIAADSGGHPELVEDGRTGYLHPPFDHEALAVRLSHLLSHPDERLRMGNAARRDAETRFDIRHCARQYEALYDGVAGADH